jgi:hypothetical protein
VQPELKACVAFGLPISPVSLVTPSFDVFLFFMGPATSLNLPKSPSSSSATESAISYGKVPWLGVLGRSALSRELSDKNIESSFNGSSTFLKKLRMLPFGLPGVLANPVVVFFVLVFCRLLDGTFDLEFGLGVRGFVELVRLAIIEEAWGFAIWSPLGGVGGLPTEGFKGISIEGDEVSRGFRNITCRNFH